MTNINEKDTFTIDEVYTYFPDFFKSLKVQLYMQDHDDISYDEVANIDDYVFDTEVRVAYAGMTFSDEVGF